LPLAGWLVIASLLGVVGARLLLWDRFAVLVAVNALTAFVFLPAWPIVVMAAFLRRWVLFGAAIVVVACHLVFALPEMLAATSVPAGARQAPALRVFTANVLFDNREILGYAEEIQRSQPDLVVLQEASASFLAALQRTGALRELSHIVEVERSDPFAMVIASRWPLREDEILPAKGRPALVRATLTVADRQVGLVAVHAIAPRLGHLTEWEADLDVVRLSIKPDHRPMLVVGDFNATWGNRPFRRLLDLGLTDAAAARGTPLAMTWPRDRTLVPALVRIDHVLTRGAAVVTRIRTGNGRGSDHRPLIADVALTGPPTAGAGG